STEHGSLCSPKRYGLSPKIQHGRLLMNGSICPRNCWNSAHAVWRSCVFGRNLSRNLKQIISCSAVIGTLTLSGRRYYYYYYNSNYTRIVLDPAKGAY